MEAIQHDIMVDTWKSMVEGKSYAILPQVRLACALRYLGGASYLDISLVFGISRSSVYRCIWQVVGAIDREMDLPWMTNNELDEAKITEEYLREIAQGVRAISSQ